MQDSSSEANEDESKPVFTTEEQAQLISLIADQEDAIDWGKVALEMKNKFKPQQCLFEFLQMQLSQQLMIDLETTHANTVHTASSDEQPQDVFHDKSNPLLTQLAIYARLKELQQSGQEEDFVQDSKVEVRKTRNALKKDEQKQQPETQYLVAPQSEKPKPPLDDATLDLIENKG